MHGLLVLSLLLATNPAPSGYNIGLYADAAGTECALTEVLYATNTIYVVFKGGSAKAAQFMVVNNWPGPIQGSTYWGTNLILGDVYTGIVVSFGGCKSGPYVLGTLSFFPLTATPKCAADLEVYADPAVASGSVEVVDCNDQVRWAYGGIILINGGWYEYPPITCYCFLDPVPTETTTWGKVKSLYE